MRAGCFRIDHAAPGAHGSVDVAEALRVIASTLNAVQRADLDAGWSAHGVAQRDLDRYYALLGEELPRLTLDQARFMVAAYNGVAVGEGDAYLDALRMMPIEVRDALDDPPLDIDRADGQALLAAVRSWTLTQRAAVLDAIERVWARHDQGDIDDLITAAMRLDRRRDPDA